MGRRREAAAAGMLLLAVCLCGARGSASSARERLARWRARRSVLPGEAGEGAAEPAPPALALADQGASQASLPEACSRRGDGRQAVLFWAQPHPVEGDAADASDPGYFSEWGPDFFAPEVMFRSEEVVLRVSFCLPPASPFRPDDCSVAMQYAGLDRHSDRYPLCCAAGCARILDTALSHGGWLRECGAMRKENHEPGQFLMTASLQCMKGGSPSSSTRTERGGLGGVGLKDGDSISYVENIHLDGSVQWQEHAWTSGCEAVGQGLTAATVGISASFVVHTVDRDGSPRTSGGDHILAILSGPALLYAPAQDMGNGSYIVTYTPFDPGDYDLRVLLTFQRGAGFVDPPPVTQYKLDPEDVVYAHIHASPFRVRVSDTARTCAAGQTARDCNGREGMGGEGVEKGLAERVGAGVRVFLGGEGGERAKCTASDLLAPRGRWLDRRHCKTAAHCPFLAVTALTQDFVWVPTCHVLGPLLVSRAVVSCFVGVSYSMRICVYFALHACTRTLYIDAFACMYGRTLNIEYTHRRTIFSSVRQKEC